MKNQKTTIKIYEDFLKESFECIRKTSKLSVKLSRKHNINDSAIKSMIFLNLISKSGHKYSLIKNTPTKQDAINLYSECIRIEQQEKTDTLINLLRLRIEVVDSRCSDLYNEINNTNKQLNSFNNKLNKQNQSIKHTDAVLKDSMKNRNSFFDEIDRIDDYVSSMNSRINDNNHNINFIFEEIVDVRLKKIESLTIKNPKKKLKIRNPLILSRD